MNAVEAMRVLKDKNFSQRSNIEKCIVLAWEDGQSESIALRAAEENARITAVAAQRDALLVAMREIRETANNFSVSDIEQLKEIEQTARAAIATAEADGAK